MFKNAIIYTFTGHPSFVIAMQCMEKFVACAPSQEKASGWVPPRGLENGPLIESVAGQWIAKFVIETKSVPGPVVKRHLDERVAKIEQEQGRKPGKKEQRELREEIVLGLLPQAFPKTASVWVWIDPKARRFVLDTSSQSRADEVVTALVRAFDGLKLAPLITQKPPQLCMTGWLIDPDSIPVNMALGRHVELQSSDEIQSVVKFDRHHLDDQQMRLHIGQGKLPTKLALDWRGMVSFVLTAGGQLRKIELLDAGEGEREEDAFDADVAIATGALSELIDDLVPALGGELQ